MTLQADALRLAELDQQVARTLVEGNTEELGHALVAYVELRKSLKRRILDESQISVEDAKARNVLLRIGGSDGLPSDNVVNRLVTLGDEEQSLGEFDEADIEELGSELFYSWYSHQEYVTALTELRPLLLRCDTSESVKRLVRQVKGCYAFQQYDAAFGLCRTLLEASIRDICVRRGLFPDRSEYAVLYEKLNWCELREKVSSIQPNDKSELINDKLCDLYRRLCEVLHARRSVVAKDAREVFQKTLLIIEELYEFHGL